MEEISETERELISAIAHTKSEHQKATFGTCAFFASPSSEFAMDAIAKTLNARQLPGIGSLDLSLYDPPIHTACFLALTRLAKKAGRLFIVCSKYDPIFSSLAKLKLNLVEMENLSPRGDLLEQCSALQPTKITGGENELIRLVFSLYAQNFEFLRGFERFIRQAVRIQKIPRGSALDEEEKAFWSTALTFWKQYHQKGLMTENFIEQTTQELQLEAVLSGHSGFLGEFLPRLDSAGSLTEALVFPEGDMGKLFGLSRGEKVQRFKEVWESKLKLITKLMKIVARNQNSNCFAYDLARPDCMPLTFELSEQRVALRSGPLDGGQGTIFRFAAAIVLLKGSEIRITNLGYKDYILISIDGTKRFSDPVDAINFVYEPQASSLPSLLRCGTRILEPCPAEKTGGTHVQISMKHLLSENAPFLIDIEMPLAGKGKLDITMELI